MDKSPSSTRKPAREEDSPAGGELGQLRAQPKLATLPYDVAISQVKDYAIFMVDTAGRAASWNEGVREVLGWDEAEWIGQPAKVIFTPEARAEGIPERELKEAAETGHANDDRWMLRKDGRRFFAGGMTTRVLDEHGHIAGYLKVMRDVTANKFAEASILTNEAQFRAVFEQAGVGMALADSEGRIIRVNDRFCAIVGYTEAELLGRSPDAFTHPDDQELTKTIITQLRTQGLGDTVYEKRYLRKDGGIRWVSVSATSIRASDGQVINVLGFVEDITHAKQAAAERERLLASEQAARAEAERANLMKDEFLATLSHELRTPLSAILGWSRLLERGARNAADMKDGLAAISRNARVQAQLIEDLLDMSRIESGQLRLDVQRIDLSAVIATAVESVMPGAEAKQIELKMLLDASAGQVSGDPSRLQQVVWNLLTNAIKFTPKGGKVDVGLKPVNDHVEIIIADTGQGIRAEFLEHAFDRFSQQDSSTTRRHGGLGIGLALVKQLVQLHGGTVRVDSPGEGRGTTFTIALPQMAIPAEEERREYVAASGAVNDASQIAEISLDGITVLVIDDEPDARALAQRVLEGSGGTVITAASAVEGFDLFQRHRPQVIVSDIGMPAHDGYEFLQWIRRLDESSGGQTPAAAFTAFARSEDRRRALMAGYQSHLIKPVDPAELITVVASLAGRTGSSSRAAPGIY